MPKYTHLIFDADHTLIDYTADEYGALERLFAFLGVKADKEMILRCQALSVEAWKEAGLFDVHTEKIQREYHLLYRSHLLGLFRRIFEEFGVDADVGMTSERFLKELEHVAVPMIGARECLLALKGRCKLYVATNGISAMGRGRLALFAGLLDGIFISEEMGVIKPKKEFFEHILQTVGAKKEECLMIGDSLASDMAGAIAAGIDCCWLNAQKKPNESSVRPTYEIASLKEVEKFV